MTWNSFSDNLYWFIYIGLGNSWRWHVGHRWDVEDKAQGERAQGAQRVRPTVKGFICLVVVVFCHHCGRSSPGLSPSPSSSKRSFSSSSRRWSFAFDFPSFHHVHCPVCGCEPCGFYFYIMTLVNFNVIPIFNVQPKSVWRLSWPGGDRAWSR